MEDELTYLRHKNSIVSLTPSLFACNHTVVVSEPSNNSSNTFIPLVRQKDSNCTSESHFSLHFFFCYKESRKELQLKNLSTSKT